MKLEVEMVLRSVGRLALVLVVVSACAWAPERTSPGDPWTMGSVGTRDTERAAAFVASVDVQILSSSKVRLLVAGDLPTPCHEARSKVRVVDEKIRLEIWSVAPLDSVCEQVLTPFEMSIVVPGLTRGRHAVLLEGERVATFRL